MSMDEEPNPVYMLGKKGKATKLQSVLLKKAHRVNSKTKMQHNFHLYSQ